MLPKGWSYSKLGEIGTVKSGGTPERSQHQRYFVDGKWPWVKTMDLTNGEILTTDETITDLALSESACKLFPADTLLIAMYGGFNQIGRTGLLTQKSAVNQAISAVELDPNIAYPYYVLYWLNGNVKTWKSFAASSRKDPNITRSDVCGFPIVLPPIPEQRRIAKILATWDQAIATTERLLVNSRKQKQALMNFLMKPMKPGEWLKEGWRRMPFGEIVDIDQRSLPLSTPDQFTFRYISLSDVDETGIASTLSTYIFSDAPSRARRLVEVGDILFSTVRPNLMGHIQITKAHADCVASTGFSTLSARSNVNADYLFQYLFSEDMKRQIDSLVAGSSFPAIATSDLVDLEINIPKMQEQLRVALLLKNQDSEIVTLQKMAQCLKLEKQALMAQLLTGKRRVHLSDAELRV